MILDYYKNYKTYVDAVPGLEDGFPFLLWRRQEISGNCGHVLHSVPSGCTPLQRQGQRDR